MPGAPDSRGIYKYAEDDPASPFSTLLNRLADTVSNKVASMTTLINSNKTFSDNADTALDVRLDTAESTLTGLGIWQSYALTIPNATGTNTAVGAYSLIGDTVDVQGLFTFGASGALGGGLNITMPTNVFDFGSSNALANGVVELWDNSAAVRRTDFYLRRIGANSFQVMSSAGVAVTATSPWTWAPSDTVKIAVRYRRA